LFVKRLTYLFKSNKIFSDMKNKFIVAVLLFAVAASTFMYGVFSFDAKREVDPQGSISYYAYKAKIDDTYYTSVQAAIDAAENNDTVEIIRSHALSTSLQVSRPLKIVAPSGTSVVLTRTTAYTGSMIEVLSGGVLTLGADSGVGTLTLNGENKQLASGDALVKSANSLTLKNGIVLQNNYPNNKALAVSVSSGSFTMNGGSITGNKSNAMSGAASIVLSQNVTASITGGSISVPTTANAEVAISVAQGATLSVSGGAIGAQTGASAIKVVGISTSKSTLNISESANVQGIDATQTNINITGGAVAGQIAVSDNTTLTISGGTHSKHCNSNQHSPNKINSKHFGWFGWTNCIEWQQ
jgi:hypothetical protein